MWGEKIFCKCICRFSTLHDPALIPSAFFPDPVCLELGGIPFRKCLVSRFVRSSPRGPRSKSTCAIAVLLVA